MWPFSVVKVIRKALFKVFFVTDGLEVKNEGCQ